MDERRTAAVAGRFYPGDAARLSAEIAARTPAGASAIEVRALVAPHAGYVYSGAIAAETWARARVPATVVILCPNHTGRGVAGSLWSGGAWSIPGAEVAIDTTLRDALLEHTELELDRDAHLREHAIEVQLPLVHARRADVRIVPIVLARMDRARCRRLGEGIARAIAACGSEALLVASTDMSHYVPAETARQLDARALAHVVALDPDGLHALVERERITMCGYVPTTVALHGALALGAKAAELVRYGNSGEASGDFDRVVGYAGVLVQ